MPYTLTWRDRGTYVRFFGKISVSEVTQANDEHYGDARFDDIEYQIFDFTEADATGITAEDAKLPAAIDSVANTYKPHFKAAMIVADDLMRHLCEAYIAFAKQYNSHWEMAVFDTYGEAMRWCEN